MSEENVVEFVPLLNHENDYEILNQYPFTIRRKSNHYQIKERDDGYGYIRVHLNSQPYLKHRLIAEHFIPNPENLPFIDHINHDRSDYHIENLRWVTQSTNCRNKSVHKNVEYQFVDTIPDEAIVVDFYNTKTERHEFEGYYYHDGTFYYDTGMNYRVLNVIVNKSGCRYVNGRSKNSKQVNIVINRFLQQHNII